MIAICAAYRFAVPGSKLLAWSNGENFELQMGTFELGQAIWSLSLRYMEQFCPAKRPNAKSRPGATKAAMESRRDTEKPVCDGNYS